MTHPRVVRWWVVELDGLRVDGPDGHRLGQRGLLSLPGVQAGPQNDTKEAKRLKKGSFSQTLIKAKKPENHMQISIT